jgi:hypothetical protein
MLKIAGQESPDRHRPTAGIRQWMTSAIDGCCTMKYTLPTWVNLMMYRAVVVMAAESRLEQLILDGGPSVSWDSRYNRAFSPRFILCAFSIPHVYRH